LAPRVYQHLLALISGFELIVPRVFALNLDFCYLDNLDLKLLSLIGYFFALVMTGKDPYYLDLQKVAAYSGITCSEVG
jgi:hypothetical protein